MILENKDDQLDLVPKKNALIIKPFVVKKTRGGIIIPEDAITVTEGRIVACGPDVRTAKRGDIILYGKNASSKIERNGSQYEILWENEIVCGVNKKKMQEDNLIKEEAK